MGKDRRIALLRLPPEVIVRNVRLSSPLRVAVEERAARLCEEHPRILRCRVTVEGPGGHHRQGVFHLKIRLLLPRHELEISRRGGDPPEEAVREAFDAARRRVERHDQRRRRRNVS